VKTQRREDDLPRVLFLCTGNSCRSQMAEGWLRHLARGRLVALSAGTRPTALHPLAVSVMAEAGIDISHQTSDPVSRYLTDPPELVIAVCEEAARACPTFPGRVKLLRWPFPDPAAASGDEKQVRAVFRDVRDRIRERVAGWLAAGMPPLAIEL
jgi:arsenate reductase